MRPPPSSELQKPPYFLSFPQSSLGTHVLLLLLFSFPQHHTSGRPLNIGPKNFEGSSKSMEASAILKMVEDAFLNRFFIIDVIVSNDDNTMQSVLKYQSKVARGEVLKSLKGKLHEDIPEPSFLADPSHLVKVVAN